MTASIRASMSSGVAGAGKRATTVDGRVGTSGARVGAKTVRTVADLRASLSEARRGDRTTGSSPTVGLVPTMGALHGGHASLIERARGECDVVVVSLFVNPSQFDERADLDGYPRDERHDREVAEAAGADLLFAPGVDEVYPEGFATAVEVLGLTDRLEGAVRGSSHFRGVTTVVTKLLNMVGPDVAYFGQKDAQQAIVIRRLVADLDIPVRIETCPTVRELDGLAMSSRNARLSPEERARAVALFHGLDAAGRAAARGERSAPILLGRARDALEEFGVSEEYLALVDLATLEPVQRLDAPALLAVAARIGQTRLIDNAVLEPHPKAHSHAQGARAESGRQANKAPRREQTNARGKGTGAQGEP